MASKRVPALSDLAELAQGMLDIANNRTFDEDESAQLVTIYLKAVMELTNKVKNRRREVLGLLQVLSLHEEPEVNKSLSDDVMAVGVSPRQSRTKIRVCSP